MRRTAAKSYAIKQRARLQDRENPADGHGDGASAGSPGGLDSGLAGKPDMAAA